ncbi:flagellar hook-basal body protein [Tissierella sp. Yu-01]|uniref:flagellar hook-basal body protein n=1 Tax=Tissierella sp. Yu-01 TaxID=3035694 RepID=UPI00240DFBA2|nr:flagellar hook-basal body protein [Tissierella sp. Yu-01]WFA07877.1 flagellar hook-basal body protein [Tissierella sp. Yu-01]
MIRSLYTVNRNMNILQKKQENTSANITNVNTPGYKFQDIVQSTMESQEMINYAGGKDANRRQVLGEFVYGNEIDEIYKNFEQGILQETGNPQDYAIVGNGFFTIQMDDDTIAYTRNGNFKLNDNNELVTMDGYLVLDEISDFADYQNLTSMGNTLFTSDEAPFVIEGEVKQGFLESSNVVIVDELVRMIEISREFEANQKLLHAADETLSKAVNEVGRV